MNFLSNFFSTSKTFGSICFRGNYDMSLNLFLQFYDYYLETNINLLDCYSDFIYLSWEDYYSNKWYNLDEINKIDESLSKLRRSRILDYELLGEQRAKLKYIRKQHFIKLERINQIPRKNASIHISNKKLRQQVFEKYGEKCLCCGSTKNITIDHVMPVFKNGKNDISNYQPLCKSCNSKKGTKTTDYRRIKHGRK